LRSDAHDRKIGDMFAFLAMSPWAAMRDKELTLNPIRSVADSSISVWLNLELLTAEIETVTKEQNDK